MNKTLVLNKVWVPIHVVDWQRAFILICKDRAEVLEYYISTIQTSDDELYIPAVIRLLHFDKVPRAKVSYSKRAILERDDWLCQYCGRQLSIKTATIDHVIPRCEGGKTTFDNTVASCFPCNNKKGPKLLSNTSLSLKNNPKKPHKQDYRLYLGNQIKDEWKDYIPKGMINGF